MPEKITIALDAMSGDFGARVVVPAALDFIRRDSEVDLILVGHEETIREHLGNAAVGSRIRIHHATQVVAMDELPSRALRGKKDSSMRVAIDLVKSGQAQACVSAGNTGALMATSRFVLKMLPNIDRPAIATALPSIEGHTWMLDLGANVDCTAEHLFQFAVMGSELVASIDDEIPTPRIGLLNIGQEEIKGNEQVKGAHELLSASSLNYIGYVEGDDVYRGGADVVVTDGFIGNVALKTAEGVAKMISHTMREAFRRNLLTRLVALVALPVMRSFRQTIDPRRYNGASLVGLRGIVIKSHGGADVLAFENAIRIAKKAVITNVPERIAHGLEAQLEIEDRASA
ncbi:MAG: phosphate acyltransferase [Candidatus Sedimenticola endophacoides]|uniref:Phosphate acyltransferase n=1 Tax=Candidatus Sedimenticola endophacoides TaxID=2548426 RepID=A0A657PXL0_9GAMM|nr:MAG: phosphate acyltransferase [Candidatus Sedimenticola endophacoides]OQX34387.1 MAG: phosphate acyltransferase [Candidatus Sedimenticola endophacoides]OQX38961.1 MAG: phosphate acyltransferase [Candidatus Sedimenticola endophacoides]OQX44823.1 MAG: phosphate acyltransferase [Candidatus Sedimenticola endophacoides]OQX45556.1 MAG: phosphate acyltransferase [Candidatus Sedimenticola endophacoides]